MKEITDQLLVPDQDNHHYAVFDHYMTKGNLVLASYITIGSEIENARNKLLNYADTPREVNDKYSTEIKPRLNTYIHTQKDFLETVKVNRLACIFQRASMLHMLLDQLVIIPTVNKARVDEEHKSIKVLSTLGLYENLGGALERSLDATMNFQGTEFAKQVVGLVTEQTALTLGYFRTTQNPDPVFMLPTLPYEDMVEKQDLAVYQPFSRNREVYLYQVKTHESNPLTAPEQRFIGGIAIGNSYRSDVWPEQANDKGRFMTSEAVVRDINGTSTDEDVFTLSALSRGLQNAVRTGTSFVQYS